MIKSKVVYLLLVLIYLWYIPKISAQFSASYVARQTHNENSTELIEFLQNQYKMESKKFNSDKTKKLLKKQLNLLVELIEKRAFLNDPTLQDYVQNAYDKIKNVNEIHTPPAYILISKNPDVNAFYSYLNVIVINVGLIARLDNQEQLSFVLAHELAHGQLDHVERKINKHLELEESASRSKKRRSSENQQGSIGNLQNIAYASGNFSRKMEIEADSLGFLYYTKANLNPSNVFSTLSTLDSASHPKYPQGYRLLAPFHFKRYPIKAEWLKNKPDGLTNKPDFILFYKADSLNSHPEYPHRTSKLEELAKQNGFKRIHDVADSVFHSAIVLAEFETIESAYFMRKLDQCIYHALQLRAKHAENSYPNTMIAKAFLRLNEVKSNGNFYKYVSTYTGHYKSELKQINHFLSNLKGKEMLEIGYNFLGSSKNFDTNNQEHYYLLWKLAKLTNRNEVQRKITISYLENFPAGVFRKTMR